MIPDSLRLKVLDQNTVQEIDIKKAKLITEFAKKLGLQVTFHRAIDLVTNYENAVQICIDLGVDRILTSGKSKNAENGIENLKQIVNLYGDKIEIMAGSGINPGNIQDICNTGVKAIHFSSSFNFCNSEDFVVLKKESLEYK